MLFLRQGLVLVLDGLLAVGRWLLKGSYRAVRYGTPGD
jgi:hypothetical protein